MLKRSVSKRNIFPVVSSWVLRVPWKKYVGHVKYVSMKWNVTLFTLKVLGESNLDVLTLS